jgi:hypothetical protein
MEGENEGNEPITIKVRDQGGEEMFFKVKWCLLPLNVSDDTVGQEIDETRQNYVSICGTKRCCTDQLALYT